MSTVLFFIAQIMCQHFGYGIPSNGWYILTIIHDLECQSKRG